MKIRTSPPRIGVIMVGALCFFGCNHIAKASTYYVATNGDDRNSGALDAPLSSLNAAETKAQPGDTVLIRGGVYRWTQHQRIKGGTPSDPISYTAYPGEHPVFDATGIPGKIDALSIEGKGLVLSGLEVENSNKNDIVIWGSSNVRISNCNCHDCIESGILATYTTQYVSKDLTIDNCTIYHTCLTNEHPELKHPWPPGITISSCTDVKILACTIDDNCGEGIGLNRSISCVVKGCRVFDNYSVEIYLDNECDTTITGNLIYSTGNREYYRDNNPAAGIQMAIEPHYRGFPAVGVKRDVISDNIITNCRFGISYGNYGLPGGIQNLKVEGNTVHDCTQALIHIPDDPNHSDIELRNNILDQSGQAPISDTPNIRGLVAEHNLFHGSNASQLRGPGDIVADPVLTHPEEKDPEGFKLSSSSPAAGRGFGAKATSVTVPPAPPSRPRRREF